MCKIYQLFIIFLIVIFHLSYTLANQSISEIDPCDLILHARDSSRPDASDFPLSHRRLPVEFHLNNSIPEQYRPIIYEAALEWKTKSGFRLITISDEIDNSQWDNLKQNQGSRNIIYWLNEDQYNEIDIVMRNGTLRSGGLTSFQLLPPSPQIPYAFIQNTHIIIDGESNSFMNLMRWSLTSHLKGIGIEPPENMGVLGLQRLFVKRLSEMSSDDFYDMIIGLMEDKEVTLPNGESEDIQRWIITAINAEMDGTQPLRSFEDLRDLIIEEYSLDIISASKNSSVILKNRMLHEFGHALGLDHNNERGSLMQDPLNITPVPHFPRNYIAPKYVDDLSLHGLLCSPFSEFF